MATAAKPSPIPDTYRRVTPCLVVQEAAKAIDFYADVFGATERMRIPGPDGTIAHAEIVIGDSVLIVEDESSACDTKAPPADGLAGYPGLPIHLRRGRRRRGGARGGARRDAAAGAAGPVLRRP